MVHIQKAFILAACHQSRCDSVDLGSGLTVTAMTLEFTTVWFLNQTKMDLLVGSSPERLCQVQSDCPGHVTLHGQHRPVRECRLELSTTDRSMAGPVTLLFQLFPPNR
ncbi:hypothetical protein EYF80_026839 [Liparis tanakae]|uniref:Uncharacterized protein n=1 Tax=Liparis tanakae TaxID=230148 RepID=A0A4Z2HAW7_9TELE|nr:hypothetical protein EYF80_026839 [Liparis tanakae]